MSPKQHVNPARHWAQLRASHYAPSLSFILTLFILQLIPLVVATPSQYCRFGHDAGQVDFCVSVSLSHNQTTATHDMYLNLQVTRSSSAEGWNAIGTGPTMAGALMFIVYGDPLSGRDPTVSVRTVPGKGHNPPQPVTAVDTGLADVQIMHSKWLRTEGADDAVRFVASVGAVCYGCSRWPGSPIEVSETSQPWIWAWNDHQDMAHAGYATDARMEEHNFGAGGWGLFYIDMKSATGHDASLPPVQPGVAAIGASTFPTKGTKSSPASTGPSYPSTLLIALGEFGLSLGLIHLHAFLVGIPFLLLFPIGVVAIHSGSSGAFRYHWVLQALGTLATSIGAIVGLVMNGGHWPTGTHQMAGTAIVLSLGVQAGLGLRHHSLFLRIRRRTWASYAHIWLGRCVVVGGLGNILSGMVLTGHANGAGIGLLSAFMVLGTAGVGTWVYVAKRRSKMASIGSQQDTTSVPWRDVDGGSFSLEDDSDEDSLKDAEEGEKPLVRYQTPK